MTEKNLQDQLKVEGINSMGYGIMPKAIMKDDRLTIEAKAIYAYFVSFAGAGDTAFPKLKTILSDLSIGENRFYKHRKLLIDCGYISVSALRNEKAVIYKNIYTLHSNPVEKEMILETPENIITEGVSFKTTDRGVSPKMKEGGILQNDGDKLLLTKYKINKEEEEEINKKKDISSRLEKMTQSINQASNQQAENTQVITQIISKDDNLKSLAKTLIKSDVSLHDIATILTKFDQLNLDIVPDIITQQMNWMTQKAKMDGIGDYGVYFVEGYIKRLEATQIQVPDTLTEELSELLGLDEIELPKIPMFDWLNNNDTQYVPV